MGNKFWSKTTFIIALSLSGLIIFRFILKFSGASTVAPFVVWLYSTTDYLMQPFHGIFPTPYLGGTSVADLPALFALLVYLGGGFGLTLAVEHLERAVNVKFVSKVFKNRLSPPKGE